jgi:pimeloyl-ACP methyl ester carboxylesterase
MGSRRTALLTAAAGLALAGGLAMLNRSLVLDDLPPTLPGAPLDWQWRGWRVRYTTLGSGPPLVLVHGVHAAASSFEMDRIFEPLANRHTIYAIDMLGFGKSERPALGYSGALYADLFADFLREIVGRPAAVAGSSLGAAYAVKAAVRLPELFERLILISPTDHTVTGVPGQLFGALLALPLVGMATFNVLVSRPSLRRFLRRVYADPSLVDNALVEQHWAVSHQPNARIAPAAFITGRLDLPFERAPGRVQAPILVLRGDHPGLGREAPDTVLASLGASVQFQTIARSGQLPHHESPDAVVQAIDGWLAAESGPQG